MKVRVERFDPAADEKPRLETYDIPFSERMRVLDAIFHIQEQDGTLAIRWNCRAGACGSCAIQINGRPQLACKTEVTPGIELRLAPLRAYPVVKDFVTDRAKPAADLEALKPYFIPDKNSAAQKGFWIIYDHEIQKAAEMRKCIDCLICQDSCHVLRSPAPGYTGPRNVVKALAQDSHPRNGFSRTPLLEQAGIRQCNVTRCCTENCPQDIKITEHAIIPTKENIISDTGLLELVRKWRSKK